MIHNLDLDTIVSAKGCRARDLVVATIVQRLIDPCSKLATARAWHTTMLVEEVGLRRLSRIISTPPWRGFPCGGEFTPLVALLCP
jgi:hypothetical protein